ncbi:MAG: SDR family oxidoreductase [Oscillospiraceae bacterium]|nr:SDR family oxidoreductase [Oscillospiraceae bacterium]
MGIDLKGFHAFITGGSSGFGFEMAKTLLAHNATVAIAARGGDKLEKAYSALKEISADVYRVDMDVRDLGSVASAADWVAKNFERVDMLVNNAGIGMRGANTGSRDAPTPFYEIPVDAFRNIVETNFIGYFYVARAIVPLILKSGGGRVVNVSTGLRTMTARGQLPYGPARAAAEAMSVILTDELKGKNTTVNVLLPGGASNTGFVPEDERGRFDLSALLPASILNEAILFLSSGLAKGMTGERIIGREFDEWLEKKGLKSEWEHLKM